MTETAVAGFGDTQTAFLAGAVPPRLPIEPRAMKSTKMRETEMKLTMPSITAEHRTTTELSPIAPVVNLRRMNCET